MRTQPQSLLRGFLRMLAVLCLVFTSVAFAAEGKKSFNVPAGDAEQTLKLFREQSGEQILYPPAKVSGIQTNAISGEMTPSDALDVMLAKTKLVAVRDGKTGATTIRQEATVEIAEKNGVSRPAGSRTATKDEPIVLDTFEVMGKKSLNMDVVRSRDDALPFVIFDRQKIVDSGAPNAEDFLKNYLTMNSSYRMQNQVTGINSPAIDNQINLRGIGFGQTLILVDGHRTAGISSSGGFTQPNINGIPAAEIERIEVLPSSAAGIYGGGATGGVINIILRKDITTFEVEASAKDTFKGGGFRETFSLTGGFNFNGGKTSVRIAASYRDGEPLYVRQREFLTRARARIQAVNPAFFSTAFSPPLGYTTNIRSSTGVNLTLKNGTPLNSPITYVSIGYSGAATDGGAALVANAGKFNLALANTAQSNGGGNLPLLVNPRVQSFSSTIRHQVTSRIQLFLDLSASLVENHSTYNGISSSFTIPVAAPNNPFNQSLRVTTPAFGADYPAYYKNQDTRGVIGAIMDLGKDWKLEADFTGDKTRRYTRNTPQLINTGTNTPTIAVNNGTLDFLRDTNLFPSSLKNYLAVPSEFLPTSTFLRDSTLRASGPVGWSLPAGKPTLSGLAEYRSESFSDTYNNVSPSASLRLQPGGKQYILSGYAELLVPLIGPAQQIPGVHLLELQLAGRSERYGIDTANGGLSVPVVGPIVHSRKTLTSTNPTIALRYQPTKELLLRGSYSRGFLPPSLSVIPVFSNQFHAEDAPDFGFYGDPKRGNEPLGDWSLFGNGTSLVPETSKNWSGGVVWTPPAATGLRVSVDWTLIDKKNGITGIYSGDGNDLAYEDVVPGFVTRGPVAPGDPFGVGPITGINGGAVNIARIKTKAIDYAIDYEFPTENYGKFELSLAATQLLELQTQLTPITPVVEFAGTTGLGTSSDSGINGLRWKANGSIAWKYRNWSVRWAARYFGRYWLNPDHTVVPNQGFADVPSQTYHDITVGYRFFGSLKHFRGVLQNTSIQLTITNVFGHVPPVDVVGATGINLNGGYSGFGDPGLSSWNLKLSHQF